MFDVGVADGSDADGLLRQGLLLFRHLGLVVRQFHDHFGRFRIFVDALEEGTLVMDFLDLPRRGRRGLGQRIEDLGLLVREFPVHELATAGHPLDAVVAGRGSQTVVFIGKLLFLLAGVLDDVDEALAEGAQLVHEAALSAFDVDLVIDDDIVVDKARHVVGLVGQFALSGRLCLRRVIHNGSGGCRSRLKDGSLGFGRRFRNRSFFRRGFLSRFFRSRGLFRFDGGLFDRFRLGGEFFLHRIPEQVIYALHVGTFVLVEVVVVVVIVVVEVIFLVEDGKRGLVDRVGLFSCRGLAHKLRDQVRDPVLLRGFQEIVDLVH